MLSRKQLSNELQKEYAKWLDELPWDYFVTLTAQHKMSVDRWRYWVEVFHEKLTYQEVRCVMFYVVERFKSGDNYHVHSLIKSDLPWHVINDIWRDTISFKGQISNREDGKKFIPFIELLRN